MNNQERTELTNLVLAPYIQKATALIGKERKVGGNQFRHAMATMAILIDYHYTDPVLLKAAIIHDLFEDTGFGAVEDIRAIDKDASEVIELAFEVTKGLETKQQYLERIKTNGSRRARILKVADRISNLTDLHLDIFKTDFFLNYIDETEQYIYPLALEVNTDMALEIMDLITKRRELFKKV